MAFKVPNQFRIREGRMGSRDDIGNNGAFIIPPSIGAKRVELFVIATDNDGWEHVSISTEYRVPCWEEMCYVKDLFWDDEDCVVQFHPPKSEYVNMHPRCLHLWRRIGQNFETPPSILVGIKGVALA
jgi:hypothetical protein